MAAANDAAVWQRKRCEVDGRQDLFLKIPIFILKKKYYFTLLTPQFICPPTSLG
jgi:hypothetical protein